MNPDEYPEISVFDAHAMGVADSGVMVHVERRLIKSIVKVKAIHALFGKAVVTKPLYGEAGKR